MGPLELHVTKYVDGESKIAKATTDTMLGLMDMRIDRHSNGAEITDVYFDEPGGVSVTGNLKKRRAHLKHNTNGYSPYRSLHFCATLLTLSGRGYITKVFVLQVGSGFSRCSELEKNGSSSRGIRRF